MSVESSRDLPNNCTINVGSRNSQLAMIQTKSVVQRLVDFYQNNPDHLQQVDDTFKNGVDYRIIGMTTLGDRVLDLALPDIGSKSLFTKDLEIALLNGQIDMVVHSLKDLPTTLPDGCVIGAVLRRDDPNDAIVLKESLRGKIDGVDLITSSKVIENKFSNHPRIGTSSVRRVSMLLHINEHIKCSNIRGNLNTRLAKLDQEGGELDAIVLAKAGLDRMGWGHRVSALLSPVVDPRWTGWCYAVGQGALAVECRKDDHRIIDLLLPICDLKTMYEIVAERSLMKKLEGGCSVPLGVRSTWRGNILCLRSVIFSPDGKSSVEADDEAEICSGPNDDMPKSLSDGDTTGLAISDKTEKLAHVYNNLLTCCKLGITTANKMIELGSMNLMAGSHK